MSLLIQRTSPLHSIQDSGRFGYQSMGATPAGPLDVMAYSWANQVLSNPPGSPALELIRGGLVAEFTKATTFILTGAECHGELSGRACPAWITHQAQAGDQLYLFSPTHGQITYLSVAGGFQIKPCFGSVATSRRDQMGGFHGDASPLQTGDRLPYATAAPVIGGVSRRFIPEYTTPLQLRLITGYQFDTFDKAAQDHLVSQPFQLSKTCNRMGYRLEGPPLPMVPNAGLSEPIALGSVQVPPDGLPIILMRDRQSLGGYPKLGVVMREDLGALAQRSAGDPIAWTLISRDTAQQRLRQLHQFFGRIV